MNTIKGWGEAMMTSLTGALALFLSAIPRIMGFFVIVAIGWFIASLIGRGVASLSRAARFNELAERSGVADFTRKMGVRNDSAEVLANVFKWFIRLIALIVAFDALGLPAVSSVLQSLLMWLPNLIVVLFVVVIGGLVANAMYRIARGAAAKAELSKPEMLGNLARGAIWAFTAVVAVNQLGIARQLVNTLFMGLIGAIALGLGLAFGLGGRETAGEIVHRWYARGRGVGDRVELTGDLHTHART